MTGINALLEHSF